MTEIKGKKSNVARRLAKYEAKVAAEDKAKQAQEAARKSQADEMKQWLELAQATMMEEKKKRLSGLTRPPTTERLKGMAKRFHKATESSDEYERMYIELLLSLINKLDDEPREQFNKMLADLWKAKYE